MRFPTSRRRLPALRRPAPTWSTTIRGPGSSGSRLRSSTRTPSTESCRRWSHLADRVRIEIGFDGGQVMSALVPPAGADQLEQALGSAELRAGTGEAALSLDAEDGRYTMALQRVVYVKPLTKDTPVGFGAGSSCA